MRILLALAALLLLLIGAALWTKGVNEECGEVVSRGPKNVGCSGAPKPPAPT